MTARVVQRRLIHRQAYRIIGCQRTTTISYQQRDIALPELLQTIFTSIRIYCAGREDFMSLNRVLSQCVEMLPRRNIAYG
jgi:hypothetical protein